MEKILNACGAKIKKIFLFLLKEKDGIRN